MLTVSNRGVHALMRFMPYNLHTYLATPPCTRTHAGKESKSVVVLLRRLFEDGEYMRVSLFDDALPRGV